MSTASGGRVATHRNARQRSGKITRSGVLATTNPRASLLREDCATWAPPKNNNRPVRKCLSSVFPGRHRCNVQRRNRGRNRYLVVQTACNQGA